MELDVDGAIERVAGPQRAIEELHVEGAVVTRNTRRSEERWTVIVKDAGNGPAVDLRQYVEPTSYAETHLRAGKLPFRGYTRKGVWLQPHVAMELGELLIQAGMRAAELAEEGETDAA